MDGGHALRTIEETRSASFHADFHSLRGAVEAPSEAPPSSRRSEAATQPYTDPFADTMAAPTSLVGDQPDWCVDVGQGLLTMTTFELWEAIERGAVLAWMRVWREGMECWTPVGEIAEFTWATAGTPDPTCQPEPLPESEPPAEAKTGPLHTPAAAPPPPESGIRPVAQRAPRQLPGARWIALGSAVAVAAMVAALFVRRDPPPAPPAEVAGAAPPATPAPPAPPLAAPPAPEPEATHHEERGQHRLPRGGRRAYGR